jgi:enterobacterial common antigen flippase
LRALLGLFGGTTQTAPRPELSLVFGNERTNILAVSSLNQYFAKPHRVADRRASSIVTQSQVQFSHHKLGFRRPQTRGRLKSAIENRFTASGAAQLPTVSQSHKQILKSSALIGGSTAINLFFRMVRSKAIALILGPAGVALFGLYGSIVDMTRTIAGVGVNSSGVRQIAEAVGSGDSRRVTRTIVSLRRIAFISGALGSALLFAFSKAVARFTFGDATHAGAVAFLAIAVFLGDISAAQGALIQGMRRISDLARISIWGAVSGTLFSIPLIYYFGEGGVVPSLIVVAFTAIVTSWWYARKIPVECVPISQREFWTESSELLKFGVVFMASALLFTGSQYLSSIIVLHNLGLQAAGYYQAAWALGGLYVGFIVSAMATDFNPRLTAVANDHEQCNRLVNEQSEVGFLLAVPGVVATLALAPLVIRIFYSSQFFPAIELLRWVCLGMMLRVVSWPMGFIMMAKGRRIQFFWSEVAAYTLFVSLVWLGVHFYGLRGAGIGFFAGNLLQWFLIYFIVRRLSGFRWSPVNRRLALLFGPLTAAVFLGSYVLPPTTALVLGIAIAALSAFHSVKTLGSLVPVTAFPEFSRPILRFLKLFPRDPKHGD